MEGGLANPAAGVSVTTAGGTDGRPSVTGSPPLPEQSQQHTQSGGAGQGPGVATTVNVNETGPVDRALAGTAWTREDVELVLQTISTLLLLYWAVTEVQ
jgi:hypothetical protein